MSKGSTTGPLADGCRQVKPCLRTILLRPDAVSPPLTQCQTFLSHFIRSLTRAPEEIHRLPTTFVPTRPTLARVIELHADEPHHFLPFLHTFPISCVSARFQPTVHWYLDLESYSLFFRSLSLSVYISEISGNSLCSRTSALHVSQAT